MASSERSVHLSSLSTHERRRLWLAVYARGAGIAAAVFFVLVTSLHGVRELERSLAGDGSHAESAARLCDGLTVLVGALVFAGGLRLLIGWLLRAPIGALRFAVVRTGDTEKR